MRITIIAMGSRGDVQPFVALGTGLQRAGHKVRVATASDFEEFVRGHGLDFHGMPGDIRAMIEGQFGRKLIDEGNNPLKLARQLGRHVVDTAHQSARAALAACQEADLLLAAGPAELLAVSITEKLGLPFVPCLLQPIQRTRAFPTPLLPPPPFRLGAAFNYLTHVFVETAFWRLFRPAVVIARRDVLNLPPPPQSSSAYAKEYRHIPRLHGYSAHVVPRPPDYGETVHLTGYWFLDAADCWQPPPELVDFLASGPPPVYVGFGSMNDRDPEGTTSLILEALARSGQRGVLVTGWGGLAHRKLPDHVLQIDSAPHDWLFPRMAAVVHHGGAGTTAAGLRAGVPSVLIPFMADQPFWGRQVERAGVGPRPIHRNKLTAERLAEAVTVATRDAEMKARATALGERIRAEDGVGRAIELIERFAAQKGIR